ncbi:MAG: SMC family ATPase [Thermoplasmata archaeon]|nr:SMC family ATPase [Thermoplasmata archaeon]
MRISYLELKNYRRFKELKLQFPDGIVGILGLNGVGKTTVIEAIAWALFGNVDETVRTSREGVRRSDAGPGDICSAKLEFELGGTEYMIQREMGGKTLSMKAVLRTKQTVLAEGDKPVKKMVEKLIGMDHKSFFTSVFARQKELNALQNVAPGERKKVVLRMLRIDGVDDFLTDVRADKREVHARIEGARNTLLTEDGRERDKVLEEKVPGLESALQKASKDLSEAEKKEALAGEAADASRKLRDELKKDVDAYNDSLSDLKAKRSEIEQRRSREKTTGAWIERSKQELLKLPEMAKDEEAWGKISSQKDILEQQRLVAEKARAINAEIVSDEKESQRRMEEAAIARKALPNADELKAQAERAEKGKSECQTKVAELSQKLGEAKAKAAERKESAAKDRKKLEELKLAGRDGTCPTCERALGEAYGLLIEKLAQSSAEADRQASDLTDSAAKLDVEIKGEANKEEAFKKRLNALDRQMQDLRRAESALQQKEAELARVADRIERRRKELAALGEISFDENSYRSLVQEHERLKHAHDDYLKLKSKEAQMEQYARDLDEIRSGIAKALSSEEQLRGMVASLEPKKVHYDSVVKELDEKTATLNSAKDALRMLSGSRDRALSDLERTKKEIADVDRVKKTIEKDIRLEEDLSTLEDVVMSFKDDLIGRIAPVLSELTSGLFSSMTEGRYSSVDLDDNYEMQIDDQGESYPISRFSGGESDLANLSLRLAISRVIADRTGATPINFLILDEIFGSQDPSRKRSVMAALAGLSSQFRQIFLITHIEEIKDTMSSVIRVELQEDGTSRAELAS